MMIIKKWTFPSLLFLALAIIGALFLLGYPIQVQLENSNYWDFHGLLFLVFIALFPRLTLLLSSVPFGGLLWWFGFIFAPRVLVAILATIHFWKQNPILVIISWVVALSGETGEKTVVTKKYTRSRKAKYPDAIEAEFKVKK